MKVKVTSKEASQEFCCADDFQLGGDGGLMLFRKEILEGSTLKTPRELVAAYSAGSWSCVEKVDDEEEESSASVASSGGASSTSSKSSSWSKAGRST